MYVHLGGELVVAVTDVVAVLDARAAAGSAITEEFVRRAQAAGYVRGGGLTPEGKSLVVTRDRRVFISGISPATVVRRITQLWSSTRAWGAET